MSTPVPRPTRPATASGSSTTYLIVQVKDNQPSLLRRLEGIAARTAPVAIDDSRNLARSRQEDRCVAVYLPGSALDETEWASLLESSTTSGAPT